MSATADVARPQIQGRPKQKFDRSIVEGPIGAAVWRLAWPTMLQNVIAGLQGIIDHVMVGHFVGYAANAAVGASWQIILVVVVFISSLFTGMGVLVARFAGANDPEKVNRVVYQAFLTAFALAAIMATIGYFAAPSLLHMVNAAPEVQKLALPFLRAMFVGVFGLMMFFMLSGAFRAAGDPRTPLRLGVTMTVLTIVFNVIMIPKLGAVGAALGTITSSMVVTKAFYARISDSVSSRHGSAPRLGHHKIVVPLWAAHGCSGHRHEHRRSSAAALRRLAATQRGCPGSLCRGLYTVVLADHMDLGGIDGGVRHSGRTEPGRW
jgi:Na+-driven multidrug efflux pump